MKNDARRDVIMFGLSHKVPEKLITISVVDGAAKASEL
jgi:predicted phosphohydrolase